MKWLQHWVRTYFGFSRTETNGFILFIPLTLIILFSEPLYNQFVPMKHHAFDNAERTDSLLTLMRQHDSIQTLKAKQLIENVVFYAFDPNTISEEALLALRLNSQSAGRLVRYREKGGKFRKPEDLMRLYGMDSAWYRRASRWMNFPSVGKSSVSSSKKEQQPKRRDDINLADSTQLDRVYGIGPVLARRIIQFRDRLGGFVRMTQLGEVYGLDSTVVNTLSLRFEVRDQFEPRKIIINEATLETLDGHPYISRKEAQAIVAYRMQHGPFQSMDELKNVRVLDDKWLQKNEPYLQINPK